MGIGWSVHRNGGWFGQWNRLGRWHRRLGAAALSAEHQDDLEDFAFVSFQTCHHLREWLDQTSDIATADVDGLVARNVELQVAWDIANGTKHLNVTRRNAVDRAFSIGREDDPAAVRGHRLFVIAGEKHDLLALADRCVAIWKQFLEEHGGEGRSNKTTTSTETNTGR